jgi:hypothetical protein
LAAAFGEIGTDLPFLVGLIAVSVPYGDGVALVVGSAVAWLPRISGLSFAAHGVVFRVADVRVPVWQELPFGTRPVCYCFGETEGSICAEIETTGRSLAADRFRAHIAAGRCACDLRNPRSACCLGDVVAAIKRVSGGHEDRVGEAAAQAHDW